MGGGTDGWTVGRSDGRAAALYLIELDISFGSIGRRQINQKTSVAVNKVGYTATLVACGWERAVMEKFIGAFGQEQRTQNAQKR
ncbi:MAG: hypothetical protein VX367_04665 [SAR324 cluster bacterium]|nr:hypothetical protein [SAR324 cluster bacterium]